MATPDVLSRNARDLNDKAGNVHASHTPPTDAADRGGIDLEGLRTSNATSNHTRYRVPKKDFQMPVTEESDDSAGSSGDTDEPEDLGTTAEALADQVEREALLVEGARELLSLKHLPPLRYIDLDLVSAWAPAINAMRLLWEQGRSGRVESYSMSKNKFPYFPDTEISGKIETLRIAIPQINERAGPSELWQAAVDVQSLMMTCRQHSVPFWWVVPAARFRAQVTELMKATGSTQLCNALLEEDQQLHSVHVGIIISRDGNSAIAMMQDDGYTLDGSRLTMVREVVQKIAADIQTLNEEVELPRDDLPDFVKQLMDLAELPKETGSTNAGPNQPTVPPFQRRNSDVSMPDASFSTAGSAMSGDSGYHASPDTLTGATRALADAASTMGHASRSGGVPATSSVPAGEYVPKVFPLPSVKDGCTEYGKVVGVKRAGNFGYRVLLNQGTEKVPCYAIMPAGKLGKGQGAVLFEKFQLPSAHVKGRERDHIDCFKAMVEVAPSSKQKKGEAPWRRLTTYFLVLWKDGKSDWLFRSDLGSFLSKGTIASFEASLRRENAICKELLRKSRETGLNPDTGKPLTDEERRAYPWLCRQ
ncbi:hypothetical protein LTR66_012498 [Elasticomyces elasticus]|nr:hypothetical protein LTR66_012498 [Elasticomyces elasticus]